MAQKHIGGTRVANGERLAHHLAHLHGNAKVALGSIGNSQVCCLFCLHIGLLYHTAYGLSYQLPGAYSYTSRALGAATMVIWILHTATLTSTPTNAAPWIISMAPLWW